MLSFNDTTVKAVKFTGKNTSGTQVTNKSLTDVICNGTHIWCTPPSFDLQHEAVVSAMTEEGTKYWAIKLKVINNSTRSVKYTFNCPKLAIINTAHTLAAGETKTVSFSVGTTAPKPAAASWTVTYLEDTGSFSTTQKTS